MYVNTQPIEHRTFDGSIELHHMFYTIQGEGPFAGTPAIFVRLAGCNLRCPGCDTDYTSQRTKLSAREAVSEVRQKWYASLKEIGNWDRVIPLPLVVLTGGEPFRQQVGSFVKGLCQEGFQVQVETNGVFCPEGLPWDCSRSLFIICSPKTPKVHERLKPHITAYKYVLQAGQVDSQDGLPVTTLGARYGVARPHLGPRGVYVQPLDEGDRRRNVANIRATVKSSMKFGYRFCFQVHKYIGLE